MYANRSARYGKRMVEFPHLTQSLFAILSIGLYLQHGRAGIGAELCHFLNSIHGTPDKY